MQPNKITEDFVTISPAYGRDYKSAHAVISDFVAGKDFKMESIQYSGTYCSIKDFASDVYVSIRYNKQAKETIYQIK